MLLISPNGMLGRAWRELLVRTGATFTTAGRPELDLTDRESIKRAVPESCRVVINCSAYTQVDQAEAEPTAAMAVNAEGVATLAERCRAVGAKLLHYSTDYVFAGDRPRGAEGYRPNDGVRPLNVYGQSKLAGESAIRCSGVDHLILRVSWLYAPWGKNFVRTIATAARNNPSLRVVDDQVGRPTSAEHLAADSLALLTAGASGTLHLADAGRCSWFEFAREIAAFANPACRVEPCTTAEFPRPARRPSFSVLDTSDAEKLIGPRRPWQQTLADVLSRLE